MSRRPASQTTQREDVPRASVGTAVASNDGGNLSDSVIQASERCGCTSTNTSAIAALQNSVSARRTDLMAPCTELPTLSTNYTAARALSLLTQKQMILDGHRAHIRPGYYHQDCEALLLPWDEYLIKRMQDVMRGFTPRFAM